MFRGGLPEIPPLDRNQSKSSASVLEHGSYSALYNREDWRHWIDDDGDCQDARAETLIAASITPVQFNNPSRSCTVRSGRWADPYSGQILSDARGIDIDHVVPLAWASGHGGGQWSKSMKARFANDPDNLLAVLAKENRAKGAKSPDEWLPSNTGYRCDYIRHFDAVVVKYGLAYAPSEQAFINQALQLCSGARPIAKL
nr:HNH endonuclease family protein [Halioglobus sp. HI00S01]